jgi:hypothetical protein
LLLQRANSATCSALSGEIKTAGCGTSVSATDAGMQAVKINKSASEARFIPIIHLKQCFKSYPFNIMLAQASLEVTACS